MASNKLRKLLINVSFELTNTETDNVSSVVDKITLLAVEAGINVSNLSLDVVECEGDMESDNRAMHVLETNMAYIVGLATKTPADVAGRTVAVVFSEIANRVEILLNSSMLIDCPDTLNTLTNGSNKLNVTMVPTEVIGGDINIATIYTLDILLETETDIIKATFNVNI